MKTPNSKIRTGNFVSEFRVATGKKDLYFSCPDCGCRLVPSSGCAYCPCCGWSVCS